MQDARSNRSVRKSRFREFGPDRPRGRTNVDFENASEAAENWPIRVVRVVVRRLKWSRGGP